MPSAESSRSGRTRLVFHAPRIETEDLDPDSKAGVVTASSVSPAIRVDGRPVDPHPERKTDRRLEVPVAPGKRRVEVMVKQSYETVVVEAEAGRDTEVHIVYKRITQGEDLLYVGSKAYTKAAMASGLHPSAARGAGWGCGLWFPVMIALLLGVLALEDTLGLGPGTTVAVVFGGATALSLLAGVIAAVASRNRLRPDPSAEATPPLKTGSSRAGSATVVPAASKPPAERSGIVLRVRPRPRTLNMIGFSRRLRDTVNKTYYEFYYNEFADWVERPRVSLDDTDLGSAWGTWWIPAEPGRHRLRVAVDGIGGCDGIGFEAATEVRVQAGRATEVEARFNFLALADRRERRRPELVSRWQRVMRRAGRYDDLSSQAAGEPELEFVLDRD